MRNQSRTIVTAVLFAVICGTHLFAQMETATISGLVVDPTGASVPGARVDAVNADTNVSVTTQTNKAGIYNFGNVKPGRPKRSRRGFCLHLVPPRQTAFCSCNNPGALP